MSEFTKGQKVKWLLRGNNYERGVIVDFITLCGSKLAVMSNGCKVNIKILISDENTK